MSVSAGREAFWWGLWECERVVVVSLSKHGSDWEGEAEERNGFRW